MPTDRDQNREKRTTTSPAAAGPRIPTLPIADIELPDEVAGLHELAYNLWWTWAPAARRLFEGIDEEAWELYRNPVELLINVEPSHWPGLLADEEWTADYRQVMIDFEAYREAAGGTWFGERFAGRGPVAYFSMEYGLAASLAIYSGGLGVLSGDHTKSASDLGLPLVGVGLLYRNGYFHQTLDADGIQQHFYPAFDFSRLPVRPVAGDDGEELRLRVPLPGREVALRVWLAEVGRVPLLLLDTDVPENDPADRPITKVLYVRGREMRLVQELVLGVGGVRALAAIGIAPEVWHINEGHCSLLQLERLRAAVEAGESAGSAVYGGGLAADVTFTTHTPVPAGNERFDRDLARRYLEPWSGRLGLPIDDLLALGEAGDADPSFNLTAFALRLSRSANAVSKLNAKVTGEMWSGLLGTAEGGRGIFPVTNGIHSETWVGREIRSLFERYVGRPGGPPWQDRLLDEAAWEAILEIPDEELWAAHQAQKERLARFARRRWLAQFARHGRSPGELRAVSQLFDPKVLTIGFARRFATYKRAQLIFSDRERLEEILSAAERPMQIVFAGKAHPADRPGQELIQQIFRLSQEPSLVGRVFFIEDYDMQVGRRLVQGVDVWLNTPRRPMEASGTSGQKAAMNGVLNLSILDGWWPEAYDGGNGWAIESNGEAETDEARDSADAEALYRLLEGDVASAFYGGREGRPSAAWLDRMRRSIATVTPRFSSSRMVRDYVELCYFPEIEE